MLGSPYLRKEGVYLGAICKQQLVIVYFFKEVVDTFPMITL